MATGSRCGECDAVVGDEPSMMGLCPRCLLGGFAGTSTRRPTEVPASVAAALPRLTFGNVLGRGGTATVYAAHDGETGRPVAVKVMLADDAADPVRAARFAAEGRTLASLDHPNVVAAHGHGRTADGFYLVMERVDGPTLRAALGDGPLPVWYAVRIATQVCDALAYAHGRGVLHRDVKPENLLLDEDGTRVRVADFGLATAVGPDGGEPSLTGPRDVLGTRDYLAPECRRGTAAADERADVYAVGVVLYEMLVGRVPVGHFARPGEVQPKAKRLDGVVLRCLADDPARRYPSAAAVRTALAKANGRRSWVPLAAAAGLVAAVVGGALPFVLRPARRAAPVVKATATAPAAPHDGPAEYVEATAVEPTPVLKQLDLESIGIAGPQTFHGGIGPQWQGPGLPFRPGLDGSP